ncbi:MAG: protein kinase [Acidobacteriia bacterium]|nr:protein kinase [Terriglobia bacterium]
MDPTLPPNLVRFGVFELDLRARELRKSGLSTGVPEQSIKILALLIEKPGEVVLREEIRKKLWPNDTVVEFDHSINAAMQRLRQALGDPAEAPQYIETLARRGYRWKIPVEWVEAQPQGAGPAEAEGVLGGTAATGNLIGKKVSRYRVLEVLGGGGMGVVFKAEDLKLGRRVALKFLPEETAQDPLTLHRFEQEARAASALNHPNICTIYGIEEHEGQPFIVMELLEGETLRELISAAKTRTAPLPLEKLLDLTLQITEGLDAAHHKGIIHRDIKPANVFVTTQGQAKILDFGLAKLVPALAAAESYPGLEPRTDDVHSAPGQTALVTGPDLLLSRTGVAMGTAGYMSPEQVRGEKVDARTDLFSLGLVLYEMAAGQRAFTGETAPILHDAILSHTPTPVRELNPELPSKLEEIIKRALEKDREARYQTASEIRADLESLRRKLEPTLLGTRGRKMAAGVAALFVVSAIFWFANRQLSSTHAVPDLKLRQLTSNSTDNRVTSGAISPDGKYLAYADTKGMYIKLVETGEIRAVPQPASLQSEGVGWEAGFWFPDSTRFIANAHPPLQSTDDWSARDTSIWMVSVLGEAPRKLRENAGVYSVSPDGSLIAFGTNVGRRGPREIWLMDPDGGHARKLFEADEDGAILNLTWSPDRQRVLYDRTDKSGDTLVSRDLKGGPPTTLSPLSPSEAAKVRDATWLPDGRAIWGRDEPAAILPTCNFWIMRFDFRTGKVIEKPKRLTNWSGFCTASLTVTADGKRLTFLEWESHLTSYIADLDAGGTKLLRPRRFPQSESSDEALDWTPDSKAIFLISNRTGAEGLYKQSLEEDTAEPLATGGFGRYTHMTPDGKWVLYLKWPITTPEPVMRVPVAGGPPEQLFGATPGSALTCAKFPSELCVIAEPADDRRQITVSALDPVHGRGPELARFDLDWKADGWPFELSPDGTRVAAIPSPEGPIYILSLRGQATQQVHVKGWSNLGWLSWAADGKSLFVFSGNRQERALLHVDLQGNAHFLWQNPGAYGEAAAVPSPDGRHLAMSGRTLNSNIWIMENF